MSELDKQTIQHLTQLCRIECTEEEQEAILNDLQNILTYFKEMGDIDTENVPPCNLVLEGHANVMRDDISYEEMSQAEQNEIMSREDFLNNAPSQIGGLIRVPPVLKN